MTKVYIIIKYTGFSGLKWSGDILGLVDNPGRIVTLEEIHVGSSVAWVTTEVADLIIWVVTPELLEFLQEYTQEILRGPLGIAVLFESTPTVDGGELVTECRLPLTAALLPVACRAKWIIINGTEEGMSDKFKKEFVVEVNSTLAEFQSLEVETNSPSYETRDTLLNDVPYDEYIYYNPPAPEIADVSLTRVSCDECDEYIYYNPPAPKLPDVMQKYNRKLLKRRNAGVSGTLAGVFNTKIKYKSSNKANLKEIRIVPSKDIYTVGDMIVIILHLGKRQAKKEYTIKFTLKETYKTTKAMPELNNMLECSIPDLVGSVNIEVLTQDKVSSSRILVQSCNDYFATVLRKTLNPFEFIKDCTGAKDRDELDDIMCGEFAKKKPQFVFDLPPRGKFVRSYTMLHFAAEFGLPKLCMMLLDCPGSNGGIGIKNRDNLTPIQLSHRAGYSELSEVLLDRSSGGTPRDNGVVDWEYNPLLREDSFRDIEGDDYDNLEDYLLKSEDDEYEDTYSVISNIQSESMGDLDVPTSITWNKDEYLENISQQLIIGEIDKERFCELYEMIFPSDTGKNKTNQSDSKQKKTRTRQRSNSANQ